METGAVWLDEERNIRGKRQEFRKYGKWGVESSGVMETGLYFWSEVEVRAINRLLCFSDLQVEPQYLSLGFYYLCYIDLPALDMNGPFQMLFLARLLLSPS